MNLFEKQNKPFAIKLSDRVKDEIKKEFGVDFSNYKLAEYFIFISKDNWAFSLNKPPHSLITEAEFFGDGKELTPMQELIEYIKSNTSENGNSRLNNFDIISKATELLPKEKQVVEDAYDQGGFDEETIHPAYLDAQDYYNQKFIK